MDDEAAAAAGDQNPDHPIPVPVQQQPPHPSSPSQVKEEEEDKDIVKDYVTDHWNRELDRVLDLYLEVFYLENSGIFTELPGWKKKPPGDLIRQYLHTNGAHSDVVELFSSRVPALPDPVHHLTITGSSASAGSAHSLSSSPARTSSHQLNTAATADSGSGRHPDATPLLSVSGTAAGASGGSAGHVLPGAGPAAASSLTPASSLSTSAALQNSSVNKVPSHPSHRSVSDHHVSPSQKHDHPLSGATAAAAAAAHTNASRPPPLHRMSQKAQRSAAKVSSHSAGSGPSHRTAAGHFASGSGATAYASRAHATRQQSISAVYETSIGSQEQIVEKAKQEAHVMSRIEQLRREGLWMPKRLPKCQDPSREKAHWDYLLEEMSWLATDFAQERKWKKNAAKKCAAMIMKYHRDKEAAAERAKREELSNLRKIASTIAKEIRNFWSQIEQLAEAKQNAIIEKKKKQAADMHLKLIVDQTEEYTTWLTEGLRKETHPTAAGSVVTSVITTDDENMSTDCDDGDFHPDDNPDEPDDEETIAREEEAGDDADHAAEIAQLNRENDLSLDELIPAGYLSSITGHVADDASDQQRQSPDSNSEPSICDLAADQPPSSKVSGKRKRADDDEEFRVPDGEDDEDDEKTIAEQEAAESANYADEIRDLEQESELTQEELIAKYYKGIQDGEQLPEPDDETEDDEDEDRGSSRMDTADSQEEEDDETEEEENQPDDDEDDDDQEEIGIESLIEEVSPELPVVSIFYLFGKPAEHPDCPI
jgi:E1A-binding protein p400